MQRHQGDAQVDGFAVECPNHHLAGEDSRQEIGTKYAPDDEEGQPETGSRIRYLTQASVHAALAYRTDQQEGQKQYRRRDRRATQRWKGNGRRGAEQAPQYL